ncbi:MAG: phosphoribosylaminoimidazolesuccinocarboxamide synthase, partial [Archaeoglobaceae archaeon]
MGSVKDMIVLKNPNGELGEGVFEFSNRYSVFDYGEMPDKIDGKGASLCLISAFFFERLEEKGIKT